MADTYKVLGQVDPVAATLTTLYTVPANTTVIVSLLRIANRGAATSFRVSIGIAGAADNVKQYLSFDEAIGANMVAEIKGVTLGAADVLRVFATLATISFTAYGVQMT